MTTIRKAFAVAGQDPWLLQTRGVIALALRRADEAIADLKQAESMTPRPTVLFRLALAYEQAGDLRACSQSLSQAKDLGLLSARLDSVDRADLQRLESSLTAKQGSRPRPPDPAKQVQ